MIRLYNFKQYKDIVDNANNVNYIAKLECEECSNIYIVEIDNRYFILNEDYDYYHIAMELDSLGYDLLLQTYYEKDNSYTRDVIIQNFIETERECDLQIYIKLNKNIMLNKLVENLKENEIFIIVTSFINESAMKEFLRKYMISNNINVTFERCDDAVIFTVYLDEDSIAKLKDEYDDLIYFCCAEDVYTTKIFV